MSLASPQSITSIQQFLRPNFDSQGIKIENIFKHTPLEYLKDLLLYQMG